MSMSNVDVDVDVNVDVNVNVGSLSHVINLDEYLKGHKFMG